MSIKAKNEWNWEAAFINGRFIEAEKYIRHTLQFTNEEHKPPQQGTAQNVQLIGFLQVMRATCQARHLKSMDPYKPLKPIEKFKAIHSLFIVTAERGDATCSHTA